MKNARIGASAMVIGALSLMTSGCFATRMVRTDTVTSYDIVRAAPMAAVAPAAEGTLVVEALVVPPPPGAPSTAVAIARPVRLPDSVAATAAPGWDPLPSYVAQFSGPGWHRLPVFGAASQSSTSFRRWAPFPGRSGMSVPYGYSPSSSGAYRSASPHFSSSPSFSGSLSSHFSGGYPGSGF